MPMTAEKIGYPLMVLGALAGIYALFRKPAITQVFNSAVGVGSDPELNTGIGAANLYHANVPNYPLDIRYVNAALSNPYSAIIGDPNDMSGTPSAFQDDLNAAYNNTADVRVSAGHGGKSDGCGCGCGGGCSDNKDKCGGKPCPSNVSFSDGGQCLAPETLIPQGSMRMVYFGINEVPYPASA